MEPIESLYKSYVKDTKQNLLEIKFGIFDKEKVLTTLWTKNIFWNTIKKINYQLNSTYYIVKTFSQTVYKIDNKYLIYNDIYQTKDSIPSKPKCFCIEKTEIHDYLMKDITPKNGYRIILKKKNFMYLQAFPSCLHYDNIYHDLILSYRIKDLYYINFIQRTNLINNMKTFHINIEFTKNICDKIDKSLWKYINLLTGMYK